MRTTSSGRKSGLGLNAFSALPILASVFVAKLASAAVADLIAETIHVMRTKMADIVR
jgi:hypothetical protein